MENAHCQFVGVAAFLYWRVKTKAQLKFLKKIALQKIQFRRSLQPLIRPAMDGTISPPVRP
jgi:hypothetical protein